jgi:hypothetical protein
MIGTLPVSIAREQLQFFGVLRPVNARGVDLRLLKCVKVVLIEGKG